MSSEQIAASGLRDYEMVFIISPEVGDEDVSATIEKVNRFITERGGTVTEVNQWGRRKLAYPIRKNWEGNYVLTQFKLEPAKSRELKESLRASEEILRHLLVRLNM